MTAEPKLRDDLIITPQQQGDESFFVVKDPVTRRFFRLGETDHFVARQLDGTTAPSEILRNVQEKSGESLDAPSLDRFIGTLRRLGLLDVESERPKPRASSFNRPRGTWFYLRLKAFDPDRLLTWLAPKLRFLLTPGFVVFSAAAIACAFGITLANWDDIKRDFSRLYRFDALLLAWVTVVTVTLLHEFAHGVTCKNFGGEVRELGFLLIYFQPAFYCNVSDAWLFPKKSQRLWVTFAGAYFELFLWALAALTWRVTEPGTTAGFLATVVMATSGLKTLFNFNPFIKLDGYYLLSDYLEIPNLRRRSFQYLDSLIRRACGLAPGADAAASQRERLIYAGYGLLAGVYSVWLFSFIFLQLGAYLTWRYQGWGFLLFAALLSVALPGARNKVNTNWRALVRTGERRAASGRQVPKLLLLIPLLAGLCVLPMELKIWGEFKIAPARSAGAYATVEGIIAQVYVEEGDRVRTGDLIARLSDRDYITELEKTKAEIAERRARLKLLEAGPRPEEIELVRREVQTAETKKTHARNRFEEAGRIRAKRLSKVEADERMAQQRLRFAQSLRDRSRALFDEGILSRQQMDEREEEVGLRQREVEAAQAELAMVRADDLAEPRQAVAVAAESAAETATKLKVVLAGSRREEIEGMEAEIARLETQRRHLEDQARRTEVTSPVSGVIITPKVKEKIGQYVNTGDLIAQLGETGKPVPEVAVSEQEVADISIGQVAILKARAHPETSFLGKVKMIAPAATETEGLNRKVFRVSIEMDQGSDLLKPEMTGNAKILVGKRPLFSILTRRIARFIRVEFWSWW